MPERHQRYLDWTPERLIAWGRKSGPATGKVIAHLLGARSHPQQGFNAWLGVMRLGIESILKHGLDQQPLVTP